MRDRWKRAAGVGTGSSLDIAMSRIIFSAGGAVEASAFKTPIIHISQEIRGGFWRAAGIEGYDNGALRSDDPNPNKGGIGFCSFTRWRNGREEECRH